MQKYQISWPIAAVIIAGLAAIACVAIFAPEHALEALSGAVGLVLGSQLPQPVRRREGSQ